MTRDLYLPEENDGQLSLPRRRTRTVELQAQVERLLGRSRLAVVYGGNKSLSGSVIYPTGNPRSWKSYEGVAHDIAAALSRLGCRHVTVMPEDMRLGDRLRRERIQLAWLNSGGVQGYNAIAHAPALLEMLGVPYIGHDPLTAATLDSKHVFKRQLAAAGIATAPFVVCPAEGAFSPGAHERFKSAFANWTGTFIVKPVSGRASLHVHHVDAREDLPTVVEAVQLATQNSVLIEGFLPGREYCVAACGPVVSRDGALERLDGPFAFACVERVLTADEKIFTSMDVSPITTDRVRLLNRPGDAAVAERLRALARTVFTELSLETLVRLDVRAGSDGMLYVLEANPKPDLKAPSQHVTSLICAGLEHEGMSYDDLILSLLADKVDLLFGKRRNTVESLLDLAA